MATMGIYSITNFNQNAANGIVEAKKSRCHHVTPLTFYRNLKYYSLVAIKVYDV